MTKVDWKMMGKGAVDWEDKNRRPQRAETIIRRVEHLAAGDADGNHHPPRGAPGRRRCGRETSSAEGSA